MTPERKPYDDDTLDFIFGKDGEIITTGVAKNRLRLWQRAERAADEFRETGAIKVPAGRDEEGSQP
jgi:hypothetical protein